MGSGQFDGEFMPVKRSLEYRWKRVDRAFYGGIELQPVVARETGGSRRIALEGPGGILCPSPSGRRRS